MNHAALFQRSAALFRGMARRAEPLAPLLTRLLIGHAFILTGLGKWRHFDQTVEFFDGVGIPLPAVNAAFVATLEVVGGLGLVLGAGTRLLSALLASTMVVALLTADRAAFLGALSPGAEQGPTQIQAVVFLAFLAWLVAQGAGPLSLDRLFVVRTAPAPIPMPARVPSR